MTFCCELVPETIATERAGRLSALATRASTAAFALPFSGGAQTLTLSISSSQPEISERDAPGTTFSFNVVNRSLPVIFMYHLPGVYQDSSTINLLGDSFHDAKLR